MKRFLERNRKNKNKNNLKSMENTGMQLPSEPGNLPNGGGQIPPQNQTNIPENREPEKQKASKLRLAAILLVVLAVVGGLGYYAFTFLNDGDVDSDAPPSLETGSQFQGFIAAENDILYQYDANEVAAAEGVELKCSSQDEENASTVNNIFRGGLQPFTVSEPTVLGDIIFSGEYIPVRSGISYATVTYRSETGFNIFPQRGPYINANVIEDPYGYTVEPGEVLFVAASDNTSTCLVPSYKSAGDWTLELEDNDSGWYTVAYRDAEDVRAALDRYPGRIADFWAFRSPDVTTNDEGEEEVTLRAPERVDISDPDNVEPGIAYLAWVRVVDVANAEPVAEQAASEVSDESDTDADESESGAEATEENTDETADEAGDQGESGDDTDTVESGSGSETETGDETETGGETETAIEILSFSASQNELEISENARLIFSFELNAEVPVSLKLIPSEEFLGITRRTGVASLFDGSTTPAVYFSRSLSASAVNVGRNSIVWTVSDRDLDRLVAGQYVAVLLTGADLTDESAYDTADISIRLTAPQVNTRPETEKPESNKNDKTDETGDTEPETTELAKLELTAVNLNDTEIETVNSESLQVDATTSIETGVQFWIIDNESFNDVTNLNRNPENLIDLFTGQAQVTPVYSDNDRGSRFSFSWTPNGKSTSAGDYYVVLLAGNADGTYDLAYQKIRVTNPALD